MSVSVPNILRTDSAAPALKASTQEYQILIKDLELMAKIGVYVHEKQYAQPVRLNIILQARRGGIGLGVVDYSQIVASVRTTANEEHIDLVEDLADKIIALCLSDPRVSAATVRVEKLNAIPECASVGVEKTLEAVA